ncbi:hypothetical protein KC939_00095 [Candidatus Saccharibacteria bacterium]|nr:hypothetical protein [Candidatus Saccharibacteria bacterium]
MAKATDPAKQYNSNPFTLSFSALERFFKSNLVWAIIILAFGLFGFLFQATGSMADTSDKPSGSSSVSSSHDAFNNIDSGVIITVVTVAVVLMLIFIVVGGVIQTFLTGMFSYVINQSEQGRSVSLSEAFHATTKRFWRLFWANLLAQLKIFGWTLLLIIPGIVAALRYSLLPYLIMNESEKEKGVVDSHTKLKTVVKGRLWEVFGVSTVAAIIPFIGGIVGLAGRGALYRQLQYSYDHKTKRPKIHWLNYLGLVLIGLLILLIGFIISIALAVIIASR